MTITNIINTLSGNIRRVTELAYKNYEIGSKPFVMLIDSTKRPYEIVTNLAKAQETTSQRIKKYALDQALNDIEKEKELRLLLASNGG